MKALLEKSIYSQLESVSCDIKLAEFADRFLQIREPITFSECVKTCPALNWTISDLVFTFGKKVDAR